MSVIVMEFCVGVWREMAIFVPDNGIVVTFISSTTVGFRSPSERTGCGFYCSFFSIHDFGMSLLKNARL